MPLSGKMTAFLFAWLLRQEETVQDDVQKVARLAIVPDGQNPNVRDIFSTGSGRADFQVQAQRSFLDIDRKTFSRYRRKDACRPSVTFVDAGGLGGIRKNLHVLNRVYSIETKADRK